MGTPPNKTPQAWNDYRNGCMQIISPEKPRRGDMIIENGNCSVFPKRNPEGVVLFSFHSMW